MLLNISTIIIKKKYIEKWQGFHVYDFILLWVKPKALETGKDQQ